jgi:hypothetical protein
MVIAFKLLNRLQLDRLGGIYAPLSVGISIYQLPYRPMHFFLLDKSDAALLGW